MGPLRNLCSVQQRIATLLEVLCGKWPSISAARVSRHRGSVAIGGRRARSLGLAHAAAFAANSVCSCSLFSGAIGMPDHLQRAIASRILVGCCTYRVRNTLRQYMKVTPVQRLSGLGRQPQILAVQVPSTGDARRLSRPRAQPGSIGNFLVAPTYTTSHWPGTVTAAFVHESRESGAPHGKKPA